VTGTALIRPIPAVAWDLRTAWATGRRVALTLNEHATTSRLEGHVQSVAATDAYAVLGGLHVPLTAILAVHRPSRLGDSSIVDGQRWAGRARRVVPQLEELTAEDATS
jgi:hypothetical protein